MATFENAGLALQLVNNIHGIARNMRDNAEGYKSALTDGTEVSAVSAVRVADAHQYLRHIQLAADALTRNLPRVTAALNAPGLAVSEADRFTRAPGNVANQTKAATLATGTKITEAGYILSAALAFERIY